MIDQNGYLKCDGCGKKLGSELNGSVKIVCPRCKTFNVFELDGIYEVLGKNLTKQFLDSRVKVRHSRVKVRP